MSWIYPMRFFICLLALTLVASCGKRPENLAAPADSTYPQTYPAP